MPISENELKFLVDRIGPEKRGQIQRAIRYEEEKAIERALEIWEKLITEARREGKDVSVIQNRIQRLHKLWWQKGGPRRKDPLNVPFPEERTETAKGGEQGESRAAVYREWKDKLRLELQKRCLNQGINLSFKNQENRRLIRGMLDRILKEYLDEIPEWVSRRDLLESVEADLLGMGILEGYLNDPAVTEVMIKGNDLFYEKEGKISLSPRGFKSFDEVKEIIERFLQPIGRRVDEISPMLDERLPDGARLHIVMPPVALDGASVTLKKSPQLLYGEDRLIEQGSLSRRMADFFRLIVRARKGVIVAGGRGSGKTTFLNLLGSYIPEDERIITIEDVAELHLPQRHVVRLEARPPNVQGKGEVTIRTIFRNALYMRPDRIILGECRGEESLELLQAMSTGLDGSLSTAHADSLPDLFERLEAMVGMGGFPANPQAIRKLIAAGIHVVVFCARFPDGRRKVERVCDVVEGVSSEGGIKLREIYRFEGGSMSGAGNMTGRFLATGTVPAFVKENPELSNRKEVLALFEQEG